MDTVLHERQSSPVYRISAGILVGNKPPVKQLTGSVQGLYELKNHQGWSVSRDDDLQVMYRHLPGMCMHCCSPH